MDVNNVFLFSEQEQQIAQKIHRRTMRGTKVNKTIDRFALQWARFVEDVENGYKLSIYDYINELYGRDILEEDLSKAPEPIRERMLQVLRPLDQRFLQATRRTDTSLLPSHDYDWWYRIPVILKPELRGDLEGRGYL